MPVRHPLRRLRSLIASTWFAVGVMLLVLTPLPAYTPTLGWAPALWLVGAPALMLLVIDPRLPMRWLAATLRRRHAWH